MLINIHIYIETDINTDVNMHIGIHMHVGKTNNYDTDIDIEY